ncbi:MAG TPA: SAM-dependent methyltransferase [Propionibacteriaceae bacterium]|nr:SAM-dependent methyltransferase [Propionibacteriaceae bacterium]
MGEDTANQVAIRARTAKFRSSLSRPVSVAIADGLLRPGKSVFDFGCGRGADVAGLLALGIEARGWDPHHAPHTPKKPADAVNLGYVVNVIENLGERGEVLQQAWKLARELLIVTARLDWDVSLTQAVACGDGVVTAHGTFQKFFTQDELRQWIQLTLGVEADAAGPGIFYVFRSQELRECHLAQSVRRVRVAARPMPPAAIFEGNRDVLEPLLSFLQERGRLPRRGEFSDELAIRERFGSVSRAVSVLARVVGTDAWESAALARQKDLLVYLALGAFRKRPQFRALPPDLQADIKAFFGSYAQATQLGSELLFATGEQEAIAEQSANPGVGKVLPDSIYVHVSSVPALPVLLRVYEGCARTLLGDVPGATVVKLRRDKPKVSYLCYPDFDDDPHPTLAEAYVADLRGLRTHHRDYRGQESPPVLHRKECLVGPAYPLRERFAALSAAEDEAGLLDDPSGIGTRAAWQLRLSKKGYAVAGHRLVKIGGTDLGASADGHG